MKTLATLLLFFSLMATQTHTLDFAENSVHNNWFIVNDGVMGGLSEGTVSYTKESMIFKGETSLDNNGGFSSVRSPYKNWKLADYQGIRLRVKSKYARKYDFSLETRSPWFTPNYKHSFSTEKNEWKVIEIPITAFKESRVGRLTGRTIPSEVIASIERLTIILFDKKTGDFCLEVDYIEFY